jgi:hypothetical protein
VVGPCWKVGQRGQAQEGGPDAGDGPTVACLVASTFLYYVIPQVRGVNYWESFLDQIWIVQIRSVGIAWPQISPLGRISVIVLLLWLPSGVLRSRNLSLLPHYSSSSCSRSPTEILEYHSVAGVAQETWPRGWKRVLLAADLARSSSGSGKIWRRLFSCWRIGGGSYWSCEGYSRTGETKVVLIIPSIPAALWVPWILVLEK